MHFTTNWTKTTWKTFEEINIQDRNWSIKALLVMNGDEYSSVVRAFRILQLPTLLHPIACQIRGYSHG